MTKLETLTNIIDMNMEEIIHYACQDLRTLIEKLQQHATSEGSLYLKIKGTSIALKIEETVSAQKVRNALLKEIQMNFEKAREDLDAAEKAFQEIVLMEDHEFSEETEIE